MSAVIGTAAPSRGAAMRYAARPFVCGAIGRWTESTIGRLAAASPGPLRRVYSSPDASLWSTGDLTRWTGPDGFGYLWWPMASGPTPRSWQESAQRRLAGGLAITHEGRAVLHGDAIGLQELYIRRVGDALYFALRIDPLLEVGERPLHVDIMAWVSTLVLNAPMMEATPFVEVRRHTPATAWGARSGVIAPLRFQPSWLSAEPDGGIGPEQMVEIIAASMPRRRFRSTAVTLSGGWDSRLLAVLARRSRSTRLSAWTIDPDTGSTLDIDGAVDVAKALHLRHHVVTSPPEAWLDDHIDARRRLQYQSCQHTWLMPLAQELKRHSEPVLVGFLGDVLFRKHPDVFAGIGNAGSLAERRAIIRKRVTDGVLKYPNMFAPGVAEMVTDLGHSAWEGVMDSVGDHPALLTLARVHMNMRSVSPAFHWLFGPETDTVLPLTHPDVISASLRIPLEARADSVYYKHMQRYASARIADIRSTNDPSAEAATGARRQTSPAALAFMAGVILGREDVSGLLGPELLPFLADPDELGSRARWNPPRHMLLWASMLAQWLDLYRDYLPSDPLTATMTR